MNKNEKRNTLNEYHNVLAVQEEENAYPPKAFEPPKEFNAYCKGLGTRLSTWAYDQEISYDELAQTLNVKLRSIYRYMEGTSLISLEKLIILKEKYDAKISDSKFSELILGEKNVNGLDWKKYDPYKAGERLRRFRIEQGLTLESFSEKLGVDERTLRRYEKGEPCSSPYRIYHLAKYLKDFSCLEFLFHD